MRIIDLLRQRINRLLRAPREELGGWARAAQFQIRLWNSCRRRLHENNAMAMSAALSFRTIFAMVPMLILSFLVLKSLGVVKDGRQVLHDLMDEVGLSHITYVSGTSPASTSAPAETRPAEQISVADRIEEALEHVEEQLTVGRLGPIGVILLIWTALTLLTTMERCLNRIFEAPRSRPLIRRIFLYWSVVTLGPLVLVAAVYAGNQVAAVFRDVPFLARLTGWISWVGPIVVGVALLAGLYTLMPNTTVRFRSAAQGALVAVPMWVLARWGFAQYVDHVAARSLYGAIGLVPLFLLWLNLSWWIFLFGAELAHSSASVRAMQQAEGTDQSAAGPTSSRRPLRT